VRSTEIAWATAAEDLSQLSINLTGSKPQIAFTGNNINVIIQAVGTNGKKINQTIKGNNFAIWQAPIGLNRYSIYCKNSSHYRGHYFATGKWGSRYKLHSIKCRG
jgi:hypothetical protein